MKLAEKKIQERIKFHPFEEQQQILDCKARDTIICAGRRFGKSALCAYIALTYLLKSNQRIWIVAPSYDLTLKIFNYLVRWFILIAPSQRKGVKNRPTPMIRTAKNTTVECKSAENPTSLLGEEVDLVIVDEAARIPRRVWESYLFPTTTDRKARSYFISTPLKKNWFYEQFLQAKENKSAFTFPSNARPDFSNEEWERARGKLPEETFRQEYLAQFVEGGTVFRDIPSIVSEGSQEDNKEGRFYVAGVDLGKYKDFTVITIMDRATNKVVFIDRFKGTNWNIQKNRIIAAARRYNNARIIIDSTGLGDPISDDLKSEGLLVDDFKYNNTSKRRMIEKLQLHIEQKAITIPPYPPLLDELESFGIDITESGKTVYSAPQGLHDDCVNSLGLAVWGLAGTAATFKKKKNLLQQLNEIGEAKEKVAKQETYI